MRSLVTFWSVLLLCLLLCAVDGQIKVFDSTTNSAQLSTQLANMETNCTSSPVSKLGLCNSTCKTCDGSATKCGSCNVGYTFGQGSCSLDTNLYNYTYLNFMSGDSVETDSPKISSFQFAQTGKTFDLSDIVSVCSLNRYQFLTSGVFKSSDVVQLKIVRTDPIDMIHIKLYFMSLVSNMKFFITLNDNEIFSKNYTTFSDLNGVYAHSSTSTNRSFLTLSALEADTSQVSSIWVAVNTGLIDYIVTNITLKFYVQSTSTQKYVWGFNDMAILMRDCQTCVSQSVKDLISNLGKVIGLNMAVVVFLLVILAGAIAFEEYQRKIAFQKSLGSTESNLPIKAMNRVIESIHVMKKAREKEWMTEQVNFNKYMNKLSTKRGKSVAL